MSDSPTSRRRCPNGHRIGVGNQFCTECGSAAAPKAVTVCKHGHPIQPGNLFCATCGSEIKSPGPVAARSILPPPPRRVNKSRSGWEVNVYPGPAVHDLAPPPAPGMRAWAFILVCVVGVIIIFAIANHHGSGSGGQTQSYKDGWNAAVNLSQSVTCNSSIAPNGDNQTDWVKGCNDGSNAVAAAFSNDNPTPTTYPNGQ